jgi:hypothetical protein
VNILTKVGSVAPWVLGELLTIPSHEHTFLSNVKSRRTRLVGHVARVREMKNSYKILVGKPVWRMLENNIMMNF